MKSVVRSVVRSPVRSVVRADGGASASTLLDGLVSWWSLDEASGTRADSHNSNDLTDNNTVGATTGVNNNAASFVKANSEYLSRASLALSGSASWAFFLRVSAWANNDTFFTDLDSAFQNEGIKWRVSNTTTGAHQLFVNSSTYNNVGSSPNLALDTTYHVAIVHDATGQTITLYLDGTAYQAAHTGGLTVPDPALGFTINTDVATGFRGATCWVDEFAVWSRAITSDEVDEHGLGNGYPG